eukprot:m.14219 g.14219  ORF g.14219 m.14219 type:complete len:362 (+) comp25620_c0_seq1:3-1088(+)
MFVRNLRRFLLHRKNSAWKHALSEAEKTVGYSSSYLGLRYLLSDEMSNVMRNFRRLADTRHPLLKTLRGFLLHEPDNMNLRGLVVLLVSKATQSLPSHQNQQSLECRDSAGILPSQRTLAEVTEIIHMGYLIHSGVVDIPMEKSANHDGSQEKEGLNHGNKMAILTGDFLLANACLELAKLHNTKAVELTSEAIADISEGVYIEMSNDSLTDRFPWLLPPSIPTLNLSVKRWLHQTYLQTGSLLGKSCQAAVLLSNHEDGCMEGLALNYGQHLAVAKQIQEDMTLFSTNSYQLVKPGNIVLAQTGMNIGNISKFVSIKGEDFQIVRDLAHFHSKKAGAFVSKFPPSEAKETLLKIAQAVMN